MKRTFKGTVLHFAQSDLAEMVTPDTIARIKAQDPNPQFKAFAVAHEGEATAELVGTGKPAILKYFRDAIIKIGNALAFGTPAFYRHEGNDGSGNNAGRESIGELVGKTMKVIDGKLHAIAAFYIYPKFRKRDLKAASYEADVEMSEDHDGVRVDDVARITGVALSDRDLPGFAGATLLASMQAFKRSANHNRGGEENMEITLADVKEFIKNQKLAATDLFSKEDVLALPAVREHVRSEKQTEYEHAKRLEGKLAEADKELLSVKNDLGKKVEELTSKNLFATSESILTSVATERKLNDKQLAFAKKNFKLFKSEAKDAEILKRDLNTFLDEQVKDFDETLKAMGLDPAEHGGTGSKPQEGDKTEDKTKGKEGDKGRGAGAGDKEGKDLTNPANNDLIPA